MTIAGRITSEVSGAPINRAEVSFRPLNCPGEPTAGRTEADGFYYVCVSASCDYEVVATQHNFLDTKSSFLASTKLGSYQEFDLIMKPLPTAANLNLATLNTNSVIMLNNLRYNDDRFELNSSATGELNLLSSLMLTNPGLTIRLENHTETNGPREYLQDISQRRVNEIRDYLVNTGVGGERIQVVAHGSIVPRNDCPRPGDCDQEIHQNNRRTEVRILTRLP
jgi:outer membrane protein OmpA-like peptidoglycan-associated protein